MTGCIRPRHQNLGPSVGVVCGLLGETDAAGAAVEDKPRNAEDFKPS